jgi:amino acid adenylation domain-containing protein
MLRTSFVWEQLKKPLQVVHKQVKISWELHDWRGLSHDETEKRKQALEIDQRRGIDPSLPAPLRLGLCRRTENAYQLIWTYHRLALDDWSVCVLLKEVLDIYEALCEGQDAELKPSRQYRDYIVWLKQQDLSAAEAFWRQELKGFTEPVALRVDRSVDGSSEQNVEYDERDIVLPPMLSTALHSLSQQHGLTINSLAQGMWAILLSRYSDSDDIVFGATVSGRPSDLAGSNSIVGPFGNTIPVRAPLSPQTSLLSWLKGLQNQLVKRLEHVFIPLSQIHEWSELPHNLRLFGSSFVPATSIGSYLQSDRTWMKLSDIQRFEGANSPLTLTVQPNHDLTLRIIYNSCRFDGIVIERMLRQCQFLLENTVANPEQHLRDIPILTESERCQLLVDRNDTSAGYPNDKCIHHLFEAQAERTPDAVAIVCSGKQVTYRELNSRANQLARHLRKLGVGPEVPVGLYMERSLEMVIALLGILKAGGAYLPLDPEYPPDRLAYMLQDAQPPVVLTQEALADELPSLWAQVICVDSDAELFPRESEQDSAPGAVAESLAYVIYTSGSTGRPKGVLIAHRGLCNLAEAQAQTFGVSPDSRVLQFASLSFDASIFEIVMALRVGATLYLTNADGPLRGLRLLEMLRDQNINIVTLPPSVLSALPSDDLPSLKTIVSAGEACSADIVQRWATGRRFINAYGPTEATIWATKAECHDDARKPSIGRPINNTQIYIVDSRLEPVSDGVPGELLIGGVGLARGYLNRPELTAEKFVPNPFTSIPGERLYKTGDQARYLPDGQIEYLGRIDHQVKLRGYRIELGEIEAVLMEHTAVREAAVVVHEDAPSDKRLVAYIVADGQTGVTMSELRSFIRLKLPEYMTPSSFVLLDELPLTASGKLDRRALPAPDALRSEHKKNFVAPRTPVEELLSEIWKEVLGVERVSINDNFFELGGHSLLATQLIARVQEAFRKEMGPRTVFESPTIAGLAAEIEAVMRAGQDLQMPSIERVRRDGPIPLSFAQQRLWFLNQMSQCSHIYNIPSALRLTGPLNVPALERSLNEIIRRHEILRTTFTTIDEQPVQLVAPSLVLTVPVVELRLLPAGRREEELLRLAADEASRPFDLTRGPLLRATLLRLDDEEHVILFTMHHIVSDGWSVGILIREFVALYRAFSSGRSSPLPELTIQYADFAHWQRKWLQGKVLEAHVSYWKHRLGGALTLLKLPTDGPRPATQSYRGARQSFALSGELTESLKALSRREKATLFMTLLAAFQTLLYRYTAQDDIVIGTVIANRDRVETESLIGFFINMLVLRTDMRGNPSFRELLARVREMSMGAYTHQTLPFEKLVEVLRPERSLSDMPLVQAVFALQTAPAEDLELPGITVRPIEVDSNIIRHHLVLSMTDVDRALVGTWKYNTDLFSPAAITRMSEHFRTLLASVVAQPDTRLNKLEIFTDSEKREQVIEQKNLEDANLKKFKNVSPRIVT